MSSYSTPFLGTTDNPSDLHSSSSSSGNKMSVKEPPRSPCSIPWIPMLRVVGFATGSTVLALGIYDIVAGDHDIKSIVQDIYRIIFGILIDLSELRMKKLLAWFSFLTYYLGLGAFYVFVGGLALGDHWWEIALAVVACTVGTLYMTVGCCCPEYTAAMMAELREYEEKDDVEKAKDQAKAAALKAKSEAQAQFSSIHGQAQDAFGQAQQQASAFGQQAQQQASAFGQQAQQQASAYGQSAYGANNQSASAYGGSAYDSRGTGAW